MRILTRITFGLVLAVLAIGGCGLVDKKPVVGTKGASEDATTAFNSWLDAIASADGKKACSLQTAKFTKVSLAQSVKEGIVDKGATCEVNIAATVVLAKAFGVDLDFADRTVTAGETTAERAVINLALPGDEPSQYVMALESDGWKVDEDNEDAGHEESFEATATRWTENWCSLEVGMSSAEVRKAMGEPTSEFGSDESYPQLAFENGGYSYVAFLDTGGNVMQLQGDYDKLGHADRAKISCAEVRRR